MHLAWRQFPQRQRGLGFYYLQLEMRSRPAARSVSTAGKAYPALALAGERLVFNLQLVDRTQTRE
jgi:hypothetical protein